MRWEWAIYLESNIKLCCLISVTYLQKSLRRNWAKVSQSINVYSKLNRQEITELFTGYTPYMIDLCWKYRFHFEMYLHSQHSIYLHSMLDQTFKYVQHVYKECYMKKLVKLVDLHSMITNFARPRQLHECFSVTLDRRCYFLW